MTGLGFLAAALSAAFAMGVMEFAQATSDADRDVYAVVAALGLLATLTLVTG